MWLYQKKLILLEKEFNNARKTIKQLQELLAESQKVALENYLRDIGKESEGQRGAVDKDEKSSEEIQNPNNNAGKVKVIRELDLKAFLPGFKLQLDLAVGMIRLLKEQAGFYLKLGEKFDLTRLVEDMVREFSIRDKDMAIDVLVTIDSRWKTDFVASMEVPVGN